MNIKITHNWLLEYLDTDATPSEIQKYLSLCGPSIESVTKVGNDYVYDIEITSNRVDTASVFGIALEAQAILPQFKKEAKLKKNPLASYSFKELPSWSDRAKMVHGLKIDIRDKNLCSRFVASVLENIQIKQSPEFVSERLRLCGIKSISNVVDISNYLMLALGQPVHVFDYERIGKSTMILRESKKGEKIVTLDGKALTLPGGDIVIEDGERKLIDLCGIMGGFNSAVNAKTNKIVLFVQTYNPQKIRKTSMITGQRTVAATYFEKGLDEERVKATTTYGVELLQKYAGAKIASQLYDIYPNPYKPKTISISMVDVQRIIGAPLEQKQVVKILSNLGFRYLSDNGRAKWVTFEVPSFRSKDVSIKEDLIEEIARIYGYHNLPNEIQPTVYIKQPKEIGLLFELQSKVKHFLKHLGLNEVMNYSMISEEMLKNLDLKTNEILRLSNTISSEIEYMRRSLIPSLIKNIRNNQGKRDSLKFFEIGKIYHPRQKDLPEEIYKLGIVVNADFFELKKIVETLFVELNILNYQIKPLNHQFFSLQTSGEIFFGAKSIGYMGQLKSSYKIKNGLDDDIYLVQLDFQALIEAYKPIPSYKPINPYAEIKLDLTLEFSPKLTYEEIKKRAFETSKLLQKVEVVSVFKNKITLRFYFSSNSRNITEDEAKKQLENIKESVMDSR